LRRLRNADSALSYLRQDLVRRSRSAPRRPARSQQPEESKPESSAVLAAMRQLPHGQREALVLLLYLGLPEEQAAAAMRISRRAVREHAARGRAALQGLLWA
jgi:DNA-directed RNA polymerase specialized sigma24 family protein